MQYRTVFVGELVQKTGLSTGGRDGDLYADAIMARDGNNRPILRASGLAGVLLATLDDLGVPVPSSISRRVPNGPREESTAESLWLLHHAHLLNEAEPVVRPGVAIHPWTGAAVDGLYYSTEIMPPGARWRLIIETDDWRDKSDANIPAAAHLLAVALQQWQFGRCWLGRSPARGLGWAALDKLHVYRLDSRSSLSWPRADHSDEQNAEWLSASSAEQGVEEITLDMLIDQAQFGSGIQSPWRIYEGTINVGRRPRGYGLDSLSTLGRDFPSDPEEWESWRRDAVTIDGEELNEELELDAVPAWTRPADASGIEFFVPGSAIRGAIRSALSAHFNRAGVDTWHPNGGQEPRTEHSEEDPLLELFGSLEHDSALLVSDAAADSSVEPELYVQELHAEDEFTQGAYASSKFNRPCLLSGRFNFQVAVRAPLHARGDARGSQIAHFEKRLQAVLDAVNALGASRLLPIGGGVWRGHGSIELLLRPEDSDQPAHEIKGAT